MNDRESGDVHDRSLSRGKKGLLTRSGGARRKSGKSGEKRGRRDASVPNFHAVPGNQASLQRFRERVGRCWRHVLGRRSQRGRLPAERVARLFERWLPPPRLVHPYPSVRFDALHPR